MFFAVDETDADNDLWNQFEALKPRRFFVLRVGNFLTSWTSCADARHDAL